MKTKKTMKATMPGRADFSSAHARRLAGLVTASSGRPTRPSYAPFDATLIGEVPVCAPDDVVEAVRRARAAQAEWAARSIRERSRVVRRFHDLVLERQAELLDLVQLETGKARIDAFEEVAAAAMPARHYARSAPRHLRPARRRGRVPALTRLTERRVTHGVA